MPASRPMSVEDLAPGAAADAPRLDLRLMDGRVDDLQVSVGEDAELDVTLIRALAAARSRHAAASP